MKEEFIPKRFHAKSLVLIEHMENIINQYEASGYTLTLRQLYYQLVARGIIENSEKSYKNIGTLLSDARLAGIIDWSAIEDRTRNLVSLPTWGNPSSIIRSAAYSYREDKWEKQPNFIMVMVEKEALSNVVQRVCQRYEVPFMACRGYMSQSEMYTQARLLHGQIQDGKDVTLIHLGDHDPSGIDMTRDIIDRLEMFVGNWDDRMVDVQRIALNYDQVLRYNPPPNPAKVTDSRFDDYQRIHGDESWELDALEPSVIENLIEEEILARRDEDIWEESVRQEEERKNVLNIISRNWAEVERFAKNL